MSHNSDRNLAACLLALQCDFITQDQFVAALEAWSDAKSTPIEDWLLAQEMIDARAHKLVGSLVEKGMVDPNSGVLSSIEEESLDALRTEIEALDDPDLGTSLETYFPDDAGATLDTQHAKLTARNSTPTEPTVRTKLSSNTNQFQIIRSHAKGGLGEVYLAQDNQLNRQVALKQIQAPYADDDSARTRFLLEAEVTGQLEHPGICPVYGLGCYRDGRPYYAMRFIQGKSLREAVEEYHAGVAEPFRGSVDLELRKLLDRFIDVCQTMEYAHSRGVLHRDIKPENIMLGPYGETLVVDWGLAKASGTSDSPSESTDLQPDLVPTSGSAPTALGSIIGTPAFMSPEQARGELGTIGPASDVYSLGATLYFLLTGKIAALSGEAESKVDVRSILGRVQKGSFPSPRKWQHQLPKPLESICMQAMRLNSEDRYGSPQWLADDIERFMADEPVGAHRDPAMVRVRRWLRRHQTLATTVASITLLSLIGLVVFSSVLSGKQKELTRSNESLRIAEHEARVAAAQADKRRAEAVEARQETELALASAKQANQNTKQFSVFLQDHILAAAKPKGAGGLGREVTVIEALKAAEQKVAEIFADTPSAEVSVRDGLAQTWHVLGMLDESEANAKRAVELIGDLNFYDDADIHIEGNYASILRDLGRFDEAIEVGQRVVDRFQELYGTEHSTTLTAMNNLGITFMHSGQMLKARKLYEVALPIALSHFGKKHPETFPLQTNFAEVLRSGNATDRALAHDMLVELYDAQREVLGEDHPDSINGGNNLATMLGEEGRFEEAIEIQQKVLSQQASVLGENHPTRLVSLSNLGNMLFASGAHDQGLETLLDAWKRSQQKLGDLHPDTLNALDLYSNRLFESGDTEKSMPLLQQVVDGRRSVLGIDNTDTLTALNNLANAYEGLGQIESAVPLQAEVVDVGRKTLGADHPKSLLWITNYARLLANSGDLKSGIAQLAEVAQNRLKIDGPQSPQTWQVFEELAMMQGSFGSYDDAMENLQANVGRMQTAGLSNGSPEIMHTQFLTALVLRDAARFSEAATALQELVKTWRLEFSDSASFDQKMRLRSFLAELATIQVQLQQFQSAETNAREALALAEKLIPGDWRLYNAQSVLGEALSRQKDDEASALLLEAHSALENSAGMPPAYLLNSFDRIIQHFESSGDVETVSDWKARRKAFTVAED